MYSEIFLKLEPLGVEYVAGAIRDAGHDVRLMDLQVYTHAEYFRLIDDWKPEAVCYGLNYLANIPEVIDLAKETKRRVPGCFVFTGGHSVSFVAGEVLDHADGAIDCVIKGEGEVTAPMVVAACRDKRGIEGLPGVVTRDRTGPPAKLLDTLDTHRPARDLTGRRRRYFIGHLDPCASIEFTRGCPWDCNFCSAWTFYGRSYRKVSLDTTVTDLKSIREPNVFIVDDVAFIKQEHGMEIADALERHDIRKEWYLETRCDVLINNTDVFRRWTRLGLKYMFLGIESLDEEGLKAFRKRTTPNKNFEALAIARSLGIRVAINIIADPAWGVPQFERVREWAAQVPEIVNITVQTPYPGTEIWHTESRKLTSLDYRLFDVQHAVLPTTLPLYRFYEELVKTQSILSRKHLGWSALRKAMTLAAKRLAHGQTNFVRMMWKFNQVYNPDRQYADHQRPVTYAMKPPPVDHAKPRARDLFVHLTSSGAGSEAAGVGASV
jgi:hopanoid C-3 methylase HpnR